MKYAVSFLSIIVIVSFTFCSMPTNKKTLTVHFENTDIIFVDPCYFAKDDGVWEEYCDDFAINKNLAQLGCKHSICYQVGDVYPDVLVNESDGTILGEIVSDSYLLGCFKLDDVLTYNPEYADDMEEYPNNYCLIKDFTGDVVFETKKARYYDETLPITTIIGRGSVNFHSAFTDDDGVLHLNPVIFHD